MGEPQTFSPDTTAISEITGQPVNTWSEEWRAECEARELLSRSKSSLEAFFNGSTDENGNKERGVIQIRGQAAADEVRAWMDRLLAARTQAKS